MPRILVTGASGFIGTEIVRQLAERGDEVVATDLGTAPRLAELARRHPKISLATGDLTSGAHIISLVMKRPPDAIVHAAAIVGVGPALASPSNTFRVNIESAVNVLEAMRLYGIKRLINISSEECYGAFEADTITEDHPCRPSLPYAISKFAVEQTARDYAALHGIEAIHLRTCWVYGPHFPRFRPPRTFVDAAIDGTPARLTGGADFRVDQVHVADVAQGTLKALDKGRHRFDAYHISTGVAPTLAQCAAFVKEKAPDAPITIGNGPFQFVEGIDSPRKGALDITRARTELGYQPRYDLRSGLHEWIELRRQGKA